MRDVNSPELIAQLRREAFALDSAPLRAERFGAEVELIPVEMETGRIAAIDGDGPATLPILRRVAQQLHWRETSSAKAGVPEMRTSNGGRITFEPGGQIEYSAPPDESVSGLLADVRTVTTALRQGLEPAGIELLGVGVDPRNPIERVPLQLTAERYRRMNAHFETIGPHGARMMRQTASIQICLDAGPKPLERWKLLNALTPWLAAIFANSPRYAGERRGVQSVRRAIWGELDPRRTGIAYDGRSPVESYARFALDAAAILLGDETPPFEPFGSVYRAGRAGLKEWRAHLTTIFPEVRPRGYFEVRTVDALDPAWYAAPLVFLAGLVCAEDASGAAAEVVGEPDAGLLERAGRCGLTDPGLAGAALELFDLALAGAQSLGADVVSPADLGIAEAYFDRYTRRGRAPASDVVTAAAA